MLGIVWLRIERNPLIVLTGERSGEWLKGTSRTRDHKAEDSLEGVKKSLRLYHCPLKKPCSGGGGPHFAFPSATENSTWGLPCRTTVTSNSLLGPERPQLPQRLAIAGETPGMKHKNKQREICPPLPKGENMAKTPGERFLTRYLRNVLSTKFNIITRCGVNSTNKRCVQIAWPAV